MHVERRQRARIDEPDSRAVVELDDSPRKGWRGGRGAVHDPVARHTKVCVNGAPVVQVQELMLTATLDAIDARTDERAQARWGEASAKAAMHHAQTNDRSPFGGRPQHTHRSFDLWKFGHAPPSDLTGYPRQTHPKQDTSAQVARQARDG
jgi:hypothetical protein